MSSSSSARRVPDTAVGVPVVYGSCAHFLGKKAHETATHKWTLFVRGPNNEDLSIILSKVAFSLHESFAEPVRIIDRPPYEVTELGWGEFAAKIRLFFRDREEQPVDIVHIIKLYPHNAPSGGSGAAMQQGSVAQRKPVMSETYDEVVFAEPTENFKRLLLSYVPRPLPAPSVAAPAALVASGGTSLAQVDTAAAASAAAAAANTASGGAVAAPAALVNPLAEFYTHFDEEKDIIAIMGAQQHLLREIDVAKTRLAALDSEILFCRNGVTE